MGLLGKPIMLGNPHIWRRALSQGMYTCTVVYQVDGILKGGGWDSKEGGFPASRTMTPSCFRYGFPKLAEETL